jgi:predicted ATP-binding protein involved in virulence
VWTYKVSKEWSSAVTARLDGYVDCFDPASSEKHMASWMRTQAFASAQDGIVPPHVKAIERAVCECLSQPQRRATRFFYNIRMERLEIHWEDEKQGPSITSFDELSDGYRNMTAMVADLAWRASVLNPHLLGDAPSQTPGVVMIDEVDLHLHPRWQRRVLGDLLRTFPQVQFVVTTHSPQVISSARPEWIRLLTQEGVITPSYAQGLDSNRILSDLMGVSPRPEETEARIGATYAALEAGEVEAAQAELDALREQLGPMDPAVLRLGYALHEAKVSPPEGGEES